MSLVLVFVFAALLLYLQRLVYGIFWNRHLTADAWFDRRAVTEGDTAVLNEMAANAKWLPLPVLHFLLQTGRELVFSGESAENTTVSDQNYRIDVLSLMPWQKVTRRLTFRAEKRGYYTVRELSLECRDLFFKPFPSCKKTVNTWIYVYPRLVFTEEMELVMQQIMGEVAVRRRLMEDPYAFYGIREYQTYDTMRQINWKATARTRQMLVNTCQSTVSCTVTLILDVRLPHRSDPEEHVEQCIRMAAAFGTLCEESQIPFSLFTNGIDRDGACRETDASLGNGHMQTFMEVLSRIDVMAVDRKEREHGFSDRLLVDYMQQKQRENGVLVYFSADDGEPFLVCGQQDCFWIWCREEDVTP